MNTDLPVNGIFTAPPKPKIYGYFVLDLGSQPGVWGREFRLALYRPISPIRRFIVWLLLGIKWRVAE